MVSMTIDRRDGLNSSAAIKGPCRVATTANVELSGLQVIDGVQTVEGDRVLVRAQDDARDNGIRIASTGNWERSADFRNNRDLATGTQVFVSSGTLNGGRLFGLSTTGSIAIGTSNITFTSSVVTQNELDQSPFIVEDRTALALADINGSSVAISRENFGDSEFLADTSDLSAKVTLDTDRIGYVAPASDTSGASGAWRRNLRLPRIYPEDAGVYGDDVDRPSHVAGMQSAIDFAAREGCVLALKRSGAYRIPGPMITRSNLFIEKEPGAILFPTEWSQYAGGGGQFFGNVFSTDDPNEMAQTNVRFDLHIDGSLMPTRTLGYATAGSTNTVTLGAEFDGKIRAGLSVLTILLGTGSTQALRVQSWNAGTRVATMVSNWTTPPDATSYIGEGSNDNAMAAARGAYDWAGNLHVENMVASWVGLGSGGKAFNAEQGCRHFDIEVWARRCGWGTFIQGRDGSFTGYSTENVAAGFDRRWSRDIRVRVYAEECDIGVGFYGATSDSDPDGDPRNNFSKVDAVLRNCGHATKRPLSSTKNVKCAPIVIAEGQNFEIDAMVTTDDDFVFTWPDAGDLLAGAGESGGLGSVVEGWGRNGRVRATYIGEVDYLYTLDNVRAGGEDASSTGIPANVYGLDIDITHRGGVAPTSLFRQRNTIGNTDASDLAIKLKADVDYIPSSVIGPDLSYLNVHVDVHARSIVGAQEHVGVRGAASQIRANRNDLTGLTGFYDLDVRRMDRGLSVGAGGPVITNVIYGSKAHDFGTVSAHTEVSTTITVTGAVAGTKTWAEVTFNGTRVAGLAFIAQVTAADTVTLYCLNTTAASIAAGNRTYSVAVTMIA
ncbi:unnamed protein product [Ciceribacter sp. T2.26MG-112.2]|uniref:hypothetical protein n=1 Tax=Ciceribacter sp. T2.26MG-112.2 TaxID=3137154 RepID=UPI000E11B88C|nr:hypothetical protein [Ciceribacter naphthalenivorans]SSC73064.1 unnamed protein product [Ciceribacter naphthalenivorans]